MVLVPNLHIMSLMVITCSPTLSKACSFFGNIRITCFIIYSVLLTTRYK